MKSGRAILFISILMIGLLGGGLLLSADTATPVILWGNQTQRSVGTGIYNISAPPAYVATPPEDIRKAITGFGGIVTDVTPLDRYVRVTVRETSGQTNSFLVRYEDYASPDKQPEKMIKQGDPILANYRELRAGEQYILDPDIFNFNKNNKGVLTYWGVPSAGNIIGTQPLQNRAIELRSTESSIEENQGIKADLDNQMDAMNTNTRNTLFKYDYNSITPYRYDYVPNLYSSYSYGWSGPLFKSIKDYERESGRPFKPI